MVSNGGVARSGKDSIDHGPGSHDDLANAVAGRLIWRAVAETIHLPNSAPMAITFAKISRTLGTVLWRAAAMRRRACVSAPGGHTEMPAISNLPMTPGHFHEQHLRLRLDFRLGSFSKPAKTTASIAWLKDV